LLPSAQKFKGGASAKPILDNISGSLIAGFGVCHVSERNVVVIIQMQHGNINVLGFDNLAFHGSNYSAF
jgi:hypothetical protein